MNRQEAQHLLAAYRPNGADASDPSLFQALLTSRRDPELAAWFTRQLSFDAAVAENLRTVTPPASLRGHILAILCSQVVRVDLSREPIGRSPVPAARTRPSSLDDPEIQLRFAAPDV